MGGFDKPKSAMTSLGRFSRKGLREGEGGSVQNVTRMSLPHSLAPPHTLRTANPHGHVTTRQLCMDGSSPLFTEWVKKGRGALPIPCPFTTTGYRRQSSQELPVGPPQSYMLSGTDCSGLQSLLGQVLSCDSKEVY